MELSFSEKEPVNMCSFRLYTSLFYTEECEEPSLRVPAPCVITHSWNFKHTFEDNSIFLFLKEKLAVDVAASMPDGINVKLKPEDFIITVRK